MILCHCAVVSDADIDDALQRGACTVREVLLGTGAGRECRGCLPAIVAQVGSVARGASREHIHCANDGLEVAHATG